MTAATKAPLTGKRKARRDWRPAFLAAFAKSSSVTKACAAVNIERSTAYRERQRNEEFALAWADVESKVTDDLEREAVKRALDGSDRLLEFLLKARKPETYRENVRVEHAGRVEHEVVELPSETSWHREVAQVLEQADALTS